MSVVSGAAAAAASAAADQSAAVPLPAPFPPPSSSPSPSPSPSALLVSGPPSASFAGAASLLSSSLSDWRCVALDSLRPSLDRTALSLTDEEDRASAARQSLSGQSKALKRAGADDKLAMLGGVVRAYQEEINALTRRAKAAETAFLSLYQLLIKAADPTHALLVAMAALQQAAAMEAEYTRCRQQADELDRELSTLKNQDATLRRLEAQLREVDRRTEQRVREAVAEHDEAGRQRAAQERREAAEREAALTHALQDCRHAMAQQAAAHQQQQDARFRESEKLDKAAREADREMDSLRADNERLLHAMQAMQAVSNQRAAEDRDRRESDQSQAGSGSASSTSASQTAVSSSAPSVELEAEVQSLRDALSAVQLDSAESHSALRRERAEREADRQTAAASIDRMSLQVAHWKHKALSSGGSSENGAQRHRATEEAIGDKQSAAHSALLTELAASRTLNELLSRQREEQHAQAASDLHKLSAALQEAETTTAQHLQLIAQLEADISLLQQQQHQQRQTQTIKQAQSAAIPKASAPFVPLSSIATSASVGGGTHNAADSSPVAAAAGEAAAATATMATGPAEYSDPSASSSSSSSSLSLSSSSSSSCCSCTSLLRIVSGQRDRLRARVEQLERELSDHQAALLEARAAKQQLQDDNVSLYEKLQYVKSFEQPPPNRHTARPTSTALHAAAFSSQGSLSAGGSSGSNGGSASSERRYARLYAESLNPFSAWKSGQLLANERSLPPSERVTLTFARLVFSRRAARSFAFFYALVLHLLVFAVLWTHTVSDHCDRSASHA